MRPESLRESHSLKPEVKLLKTAVRERGIDPAALAC